MNKKRNRLLSLVMCIAMLVSMLPVIATATSAAEIDHIIFDFRSEATLTASGMAPYRHNPTAGEPDPYTGGKFEYSSDKQAMRILYAESTAQPIFRLMSVTTKPNTIPAEYKYFVVVYAAKTDDTFDIILSNSVGKGEAQTLVKGGKDTADKFVISDVGNIGIEKNGASIMSRWNMAGVNNRINFKSTDIDAEFYIKEYGLFKSEADAKAYYASADLSKSPAVYNTANGTAAPATPATPAAPAAKGTFTVTPGPTIEEENKTSESGSTEDARTDIEPYVIDMSGWGGFNRSQVQWYYHNGSEEGKQKMVVNSGEDNSCQFLYAPGSSWSPYRGMLKFKAKDIVTMDYKFARMEWKVIDGTAGQIRVTNNGGAGSITVVQNTKIANGEWAVSAPFDLTKAQLIDRFVNHQHVTIEYTGTNPDAKVYLRKIVLFASLADAYAYYGDEVSAGETYINHSALTFGNGGTAGFLAGDSYGKWAVNEEDKTLDISYGVTNRAGSMYMAKIKFNNAGNYDLNNVYTRILYSAKNPEGAPEVNFYMYNDAQGGDFLLADKVKDTDGKFVLSEVRCVSSLIPPRFKSGMHCSFFVNTAEPGGEYRIKAIYFFQTREMAEKFSLDGGSTELTINGNPIDNYQIVISDYTAAMTAATSLQLRIHELSGKTLPIVKDTAPESEYEIIIGKSSRPESTAKLEELQAAEYKEHRSINFVDGKKLVFVSEFPQSDIKLISNFNLTYLYENISNVPEKIDITSAMDVDTVIAPFKLWDWGEDVNVADPEVFESDFSYDLGYFTEENGQDNFEYYNGVYRTVAGVKKALSFIHVYERDTEFSVDMKYTDADKNAEIGIMTRYSSEDAWVKAGYDFEKGEWFIASSEGLDFYEARIASVKAEIKEGTVYRLTLKVDEDVAKFYVNGTKIMETEGASHTTPGRVAFYTDGASIEVDNAKFVLMSGEGTIWKNVEHTKLPVDSYIEGGSVFEMNDGSLIYQHHSNNTFKSTDNGKTWAKIDPYFPNAGYINIIRLNNGDWMQMFTEGGYWKSRTSSDDGKTWVTGGTICATKYKNTAAGAGNMNDKLMQFASGRIFYGQNYEINQGTVDGRTVFCEFYYSDDNGKTWTKSETDSWEIEGNESTKYFGECKLLECSDGTVRMYNSWSTHRCIVYSDSKDGGKSFGPLQRMEDFPTSRSSMQFVRDVYADNDYTYYMIWINNPSTGDAMPRSRLSLAKSTDGKNWTVLGDVWRWESNYVNSSHIQHIVDPFVKVTEDYLLVGSGFSEFIAEPGAPSVANYHNAQRQHIYAIPKASLEAGEGLYKFTDVTANDSYYDAVKFAVDNGLFNGTSETTFAPDTVMNRAMFVTVLARLDGAKVDNNAATEFTDVKVGEWYTGSVAWAAKNGIVNGIGGGKYGYDGQITVEQACTILARYANGKTAAEKSGMTVADFTDGDCVSSWAADGVKWAVENGIYNGVGESLAPTCAAPRWLVATMFANYASLIK